MPVPLSEAQEAIWKRKQEDNDRAQKEHNDKMMFRVTALGVLVAVITVGISYWAARDTSENSRKGLELQSKSIDAQIDSMRNDQRPYASVTFAGIKQYPFPGEWADENRLAPILVLTVRGHTPALHTTINMGCAPIDAINFHDVRNVPVTHDTVVAEYTPSTMFPDEKLSIPCSDPINWIPKDKPGIIVRGEVWYTDFSKQIYKTPFCYRYYSSNNKLEHCTEDEPT